MTGRLAVVALVVATSAVVPGTAVAGLAENEPPLADAGLDQHAERGESVLLDATGSRDPDGEIAGFEWRIEAPGGEVVRPACTDCPRTRFSVEQAGRYAVTVTVTDDGGATSTDTLFVDVEASESDSSESEEEKRSPVATGDSGGTAPVSPDASGCPDNCAESTVPWIEIHGPSTVATEEDVTFDVEYGGFSSEPQIGWSISGHGESATETWHSPGEETIYATGATDSETARDTHSVQIAENERPEVAIKTPTEIHPGKSITFVAEASDPDGYVDSVQWENGPRVKVPEQGEKPIKVTATDNQGATASSQLTLTSLGVKSRDLPQDTALHTVRCYYDEEPERKRQSPDHCEIVDSDNSPDSDGYHSDTGDIERMLQSPNYDVIWRKTERNVKQHRGDLDDDRGTLMPDVVDNDGTTPILPSLDTSQRNAIRGRAVETNSESFTLDGETVRNDLNSDGEINSADWDQRYGTQSSENSERHDEAIDELKDSQQADRQARGGGGAAAGSSSSSKSSSTQTWSSQTSTSDGGSSGTTTESDSKSTTSGEVAVNKAQRITNGSGMGAGLY